MPEYNIDAHLDVHFGPKSLIAFIIAIYFLYNLEAQFSVKLGLFIGGVALLKLLSQRRAGGEATD